MAGLIEELKRRKVFKVGAAYLVVAWLAVQGASIGFPAFDAPPWALRVFILVALLGFPVAVVMAWVFDTSEGELKLDARDKATRGVIGVAVALVALALVWFARGQPAYRPGEAPAAAGAPGAAAPAPASAIPAKSIAVLAFTDLSPQKDQEYFSDGIAEEILNALAQVKDLKVAGRTSAFSYKGRNVDLRQVGRELAVANVLEGSVRKQGERVRITAQLIQTSDGTHRWSKTYDGDLRDVFQLQEQIARAITDELQVLLDEGQKARLVPVATKNPEAYQLYLQARRTFDRRDGIRMGEAIAQLRQAIALDPGYARAWSTLAALYAVKSTYDGKGVHGVRESVDVTARKAIALDPTLAEPWAVMGVVADNRPGGALRQRANFDKAIQVDPEDVTTNFWSGLGLLRSGYLRNGTQRIERALSVDPMLPNGLRWRGTLYLRAGDLARAEPLLRQARQAGLTLASRELAEIEAARGSLDLARALWMEGSGPLINQLPPGTPGAISEALYGGDAAARTRALQLIDAYLALPVAPEQAGNVSGLVPMYLYRLGRGAQALEVDATRVDGDNTDFMVLAWSPEGEALRKLPEFPAWLKRKGLPEVWAKYGPPDVGTAAVGTVAPAR